MKAALTVPKRGSLPKGMRDNAHSNVGFPLCLFLKICPVIQKLYFILENIWSSGAVGPLRRSLKCTYGGRWGGGQREGEHKLPKQKPIVSFLTG